MNDAISILREKVAKAEAKVLRAEKSLESARTELSDLQTALRVLGEITGESDANPQSAGTTSAVASRQAVILEILGVGQENGKSPAELFAAYKEISGEDLSIDTFRTTVWRMKDRTFDVDNGTVWVQGDVGQYWKKWVDKLTPEAVWDESAWVDEDSWGDDPHKENEPRSDWAGGSDASGWDDPPSWPEKSHSDWGRGA